MRVLLVRYAKAEAPIERPYSFGLLCHMGTNGFQAWTSFWKLRASGLPGAAFTNSSSGAFTSWATYSSTCLRIRGSFSAARSSGFSMCVKPWHSGHFTRSSLIMVSLPGEQICEIRWRSATRPLPEVEAGRAVAAVISVAWSSDRNHNSGITGAWASRSGWFENYAPAAAAVHHHAEWLRKPQMPDAPFLSNRGLLIQPLPIQRTFSGVWVHGEVADLKCCQVLKEMAALRWGHAKIAEAGFHDHTGP